MQFSCEERQTLTDKAELLEKGMCVMQAEHRREGQARHIYQPAHLIFLFILQRSEYICDQN